MKCNPVELLAPAGDPEAGYAALHYGADALYLGLKKFSARADAANFNTAELGEIAAFAHSLRPRRRVYVALNTLILDAELDAVIRALGEAAECSADAVIVQDLGVARLVRRHFPQLALHASTQLSVHNLEGARVLQRLGFRRVTLARELTLDEIRTVAALPGIETEVFIHGALCYAYSGLCLYSSLWRGRSGNRGRCAYPCRQTFHPLTAEERETGRGSFLFSMKDLALNTQLPALRAAGVASMKIEGRKKSALYVAAAVALYRGILDGTLTSAHQVQLEADLKTVFSRPWTRLYSVSRSERGVTDREVVGHRGEAIGRVETVRRGRPAAGDRLRFRTQRQLERHDGLQVDLPDAGKPFGFAVDQLWVDGGKAARNRPAFEVPAGAWVEVGLPPDHPPIPAGAPVYCSSSQAVKQKYRFTRPKPGAFRSRRIMNLMASLDRGGCELTARVDAAGFAGGSIEVRRVFAADLSAARSPAATEQAVQSAFARLGDTGLALGELRVQNSGGVFVPVSLLNQWRRMLVADVAAALAKQHDEHIAAIIADTQPERRPQPETDRNLRWSLKTDRLAVLDEFTNEDWRNLDELVIAIGADASMELDRQLIRFGEAVGRNRIRLALPIIMRAWETAAIKGVIARLCGAGWWKWEAANLYAWDLLGSECEVAADWSVYVLNREASRLVGELGATRITLSPEDGFENMEALAREFGRAVTAIVYQDTPLFISETCPRRGMWDCDGRGESCTRPLRLQSAGGERVEVVTRHCRAVTLNAAPLSLAGELDRLVAAGLTSFRADFVFREYSPADVVGIWRRLRGHRQIAGHQGNFERGLA